MSKVWRFDTYGVGLDGKYRVYCEHGRDRLRLAWCDYSVTLSLRYSGMSAECACAYWLHYLAEASPASGESVLVWCERLRASDDSKLEFWDKLAKDVVEAVWDRYDALSDHSKAQLVVELCTAASKAVFFDARLSEWFSE